VVELEIVFTDVAKRSLKFIYLYYRKKAGLKVAKSVKGTILADIQKLKRHSRIGNKEGFLQNLEKGYRKLISGNYKIVYRIVNREIIIDTIFDTRQEPIELLKGLKK